MLEYDGVSEWEFEVSFRGEYDPIFAMENQIHPKDIFPHVYITFVTNAGGYAIAITVTFWIVYGLVAMSFLSGCDCCPEETPSCCYRSSSAKNDKSSSNVRWSAARDHFVNDVAMTTNLSHAEKKTDSAFNHSALNVLRSKFTRGMGSRVLRNNNGDHTRIPIGKSKTAVLLKSNDISTLVGGRDAYIQHIDIDDNNLTHMNGVENYSSLETLIATGNNIKSLSINSIASNLKILDVGGNDIHKLFQSSLFATSSMVSSYPTLKVLLAKNNDINDMKGLAIACPRLTHLQLCNNDLNNVFSELRNLNYLTHVDMENNDIKVHNDDLVEFATTCTSSLKHLNLRGNDIPTSKLRQTREIFRSRGMTLMILADDGDAQVNGVDQAADVRNSYRLPDDWYETEDPNSGKRYFYNTNGQTSWTFPTASTVEASTIKKYKKQHSL